MQVGSKQDLHFKQRVGNLEKTTTLQFFSPLLQSQNYPLSQPVMKLEGYSQCAGESVYANDYPHTDQDVWCAWVVATEVNATIASIDPSKAMVCI